MNDRTDILHRTTHERRHGSGPPNNMTWPFDFIRNLSSLILAPTPLSMKKYQGRKDLGDASSLAEKKFLDHLEAQILSGTPVDLLADSKDSQPGLRASPMSMAQVDVLLLPISELAPDIDEAAAVVGLFEGEFEQAVARLIHIGGPEG